MGTTNKPSTAMRGIRAFFIMAAVAALAAPTSWASVLDDAVFKLDLRGGASTYTKPGDLGNAYDFSSSAETKAIGFMGDQLGAQTYSPDYGNLPAQETVAVTNPWYPMTTNTTTCLHFYQDWKAADRYVRSSVVISNAATHAATQTFYMRFRWDGVANAADNRVFFFQNGNATNGGSQDEGTAIGMWRNLRNNNTVTNWNLGFRAGKQTADSTDLNIATGVWNDVFFTFTPNEGGGSYRVTGSLCKTPTFGGSGFPRSEILTAVWPSVAKTSIAFNTRNLTLGGYSTSTASGSPSDYFRGLSADFMIWERALTDDEKIEVMAGRHGAKWTIGAANGSADEFNDGADANVPVADVFEPETMPWRRMRKTLDASHPSLSIKSPLTTGETNMPMIVSVTPILSGIASAPVTISVNGAQVAAETLVSGRTHNIVIPEKRWQRDANGNVTVALTRTTTAGTLSIDAIALSGSWCAGGTNSSMSDNDKVVPYAFAGDPVNKHFTRHFTLGDYATNMTFAVWLPQGMGGRCGYKFSTTVNQAAAGGLENNFALLVNGAVVATRTGSFAANELFEADLPEGAFHDGMNIVQFRQTSPTRAEAMAASVSVWSTYNYYRMTLVPPPVGMVIVFR